VIGLAANDRAQCHQRVVTPSRKTSALEGHRLQRERDFERARDADHIDVGSVHAQLHQLPVACGEQLAHDFLVEAAPDHADVQALAVQLRLHRLLHTAFTATASSGETYSTTSRPKPDMLGMRLGRASTRILPTLRSFRICAPMPCRRGSHGRAALRRLRPDSSKRSRISEAESCRRKRTITPSLWCATMRIASCTEKAWREASKSKRSSETNGSCTRTSVGRSGRGSPRTSA